MHSRWCISCEYPCVGQKQLHMLLARKVHGRASRRLQRAEPAADTIRGALAQCCCGAGQDGALQRRGFSVTTSALRITPSTAPCAPLRLAIGTVRGSSSNAAVAECAGWPICSVLEPRTASGKE